MPEFYTRLLELRRAEVASRGLAKVPPELYAQTVSYLGEVRATYETELKENPSGRKGDLARQTHARALQGARDLVEARMSKVLAAAFQSAVGGSRDLVNGLPEERHLFERLVEGLRQFRLASAPYLEPGASSAPALRAAPAPSTPAPTDGAAPRAPSHPAREAPAASGHARAGSEPVLVRILKGSPPLEFGGETLELRPEDLLSVAPELARILVDGKVAERILADPESS
ncbi:MAG: hypothetical protein ACYDFT_01625 [Thermoplasmata archaeon]